MNILRVKTRYADDPDTDTDEIMLASTAANRWPGLGGIIADPEFTRLEYSVDLMEFSVSVWERDHPLSAHDALRLALETLSVMNGISSLPKWARNDEWLMRALREAADNAAAQETARDDAEEELDRALGNLESLVLQAMKLRKRVPNANVPEVVDRIINHVIAYVNEEHGNEDWQTSEEEAVGFLKVLVATVKNMYPANEHVCGTEYTFLRGNFCYLCELYKYAIGADGWLGAHGWKEGD